MNIFLYALFSIYTHKLKTIYYKYNIIEFEIFIVIFVALLGFVDDIVDTVCFEHEEKTNESTEKLEDVS